MGTCESIFNDNTLKSKHKKNRLSQSINQNQKSILTNKNQNQNYFRSPIDNSTAENNFVNMSATQSQLTLGNISGYNIPQRPKEYKYINQYRQNNNLQNSLVNGSLVGLNQNSMTYSANNTNSKLNMNSMSMSQSYGEYIIDGKINRNMEGNREFNTFIDNNTKKDVSAIDIINDIDDNYDKDSNKNDSNNNTKDINFYQKKTSKNSNLQKEIKNNNDEAYDKICEQMPMDSEF